MPPGGKAYPSRFSPPIRLPPPLARSFSALAADASEAATLPFSYTQPLPNHPRLHSRIPVPKVLPILPRLAEEEKAGMAQPVHLQYNSPMSLYSRETAEEQFQQQVGDQLGGAIPLPAPPAEKHFDPSRSKVLEEIHNERQDTFGQNFAEKIARAETPKVQPQQEPAWARYAREKSERARSRTPGREYSNTPADPVPPQAYYNQPLGAAEEAREYAEKSRTFVHTKDPTDSGPAYYEVARNRPRRRHSGPPVDRGYELGGLDYTKGLQIEGAPGDYEYYYSSRQQRSPSQPSRTEFGQDYGTGEIGMYGPYHGHGPDPPRLRPRYSADPRDPCNAFVAPNIDGVDPSLLVGDTLSNQKVRPAPPPPPGHFGTSFAPSSGLRRDHLRMERQERPASPPTFSLSAKKPSGASSAPSHQTDVWRYRQAETDKQIYQSEPNWKRNVDQRKNAWERRAFETEQHLNLPASAKVEPDRPPEWSNRAEYTHNVWGRQANQQTRAQAPAHSPQPRIDGQQHQFQQSNYNTSSNNFSQQQQQYQPSQTGYVNGSSNGYQQLQPATRPNTQLSPAQGYSVHSTESSGDPASGNYSRAERHETERRGDGSYEINRSFRSENKNTSHQTIPMAPPVPPPPSQYTAVNNNWQQQQQQTVRQAPMPEPPRPYVSRGGIETDVLNQGFNSNQLDYVRSHQVANAPPGRVSTSSTSRLADGGQRYSNFTRDVSGQPGGPAYSASEQYETETRRPDGRSFERSSYSHSENRTSTTTTTPAAPVYAPAPLTYSSDQRNDQSRNVQQTQNVMSNNMANNYNTSDHYKKYLRDEQHTKKTTTTTTTTTQPVPVQHQPISNNTTYNYTQQPVYTPNTPGETSYEHYKTSRNEEHREESRPVSQVSNYSEQKNYNYEKSRNEKTTTTTTTTTAAPIALPPPQSTYQNTSSQDAFDRRAEMSESLPKGSISNTMNNAEGAYHDQKGHDVFYKRELSTATDPGRDMALLKEEEKRVVETPLEPGVISRHVTTKYYKKKTTTDTTTTTADA